MSFGGSFGDGGIGLGLVGGRWRMVIAWLIFMVAFSLLLDWWFVQRLPIRNIDIID